MKAPDPTPPTETSAAATGTNVSTAIANAWLTNPNVVTPQGTQSTSQSGEYTWTDPYTNETYTVPTFTTTQTYSPEQQAIYDQQAAAQLNLASLGNQQAGFLQDYMSQPFSLDNAAVENRLYELGTARLDPRFAHEEEALRTRLANQGIRAGSEAYDREMGLLNQSRNDAYNQLALTGRSQALQELLAGRNQPINEITALLSGGQVSQPNFATGTNASPIPTTDNAAIIANYDQQQLAAAQMNASAFGSILSGLGGLFALSDERAKDDVEKIGETKDGLGLYSYRYKGSPETQIGLMAQEVAKEKPEAVAMRPDGLLAVDYERALKKKRGRH